MKEPCPHSACAVMLVRLQLSKDFSLLSPCPSRPGMAAGEGRLAGAHVCRCGMGPLMPDTPTQSAWESN